MAGGGEWLNHLLALHAAPIKSDIGLAAINTDLPHLTCRRAPLLYLLHAIYYSISNIVRIVCQSVIIPIHHLL